MKKSFSVLLAFLLAVLSSATVLYVSATDVDMGYEGVLDSYYDSDGIKSVSDDSTARTTVTGNISYDSTSKLFYYLVSDIAKPFTSNVCDGMVTTEAVSLSAPDGISAQLYRDGELYDGDLNSITATGNYVYRVGTNQDTSERILEFTIVGKVTGLISSYTIPDGFAVDSLTFNGEMKQTSSSVVTFDEDGDYNLSYRCSATRVVYSLNITIDHTPPEIVLEGIEDGKIRGPVEIKGLEEGASVSVYRDGEAEAYTSTLTKSGKYDLIVTDKAGNKSTYSFTILIYLNYGTFFFFAAIVLIIVAVAVWMIVSKKKMRVR